MTNNEKICKLFDENYLLTQMFVKAIKESSTYYNELNGENSYGTIHDAATRIKTECEALTLDVSIFKTTFPVLPRLIAKDPPICA